MDFKEVKIGLLLFFILILAGILLIKIEPPAIGEEMTYLEDPLYKNKELNFDSKQSLFYVYTSQNLSTNMTYEIQAMQGCIWMNRPGYPALSCIGKDGTDETGSNITLADNSLFFFKPWMLAVDGGWEWHVEGCFEINGERECGFGIDFRTIRVDFVDGKLNYVVKIDYGSSTIYQWIEEERRIVTKELGPDYVIVLEN